MIKNISRFSLPLVGFLQALGLIIYCLLVGLIFWKGSTWFGPQTTLLGPMFVLILLVVSVLICALISFSYPFYLWQQNKIYKALKLVAYTTGWLVIFSLVAVLILILT
ncbi:hypothetical protein KKE18_00235 [Patescibacteria group bacterium]|nr:hypothetical protein [Patescibacteria group bacterium]MBU1844605.1 hypothetical protein [Patescibacteria group bacterium]